MDTEDAADANGVEAAVVDQPANCLRVDAQLIGDVTDADQTPGFFAYRRHNSDEALQVRRSRSWANRTNRSAGRTYWRRKRVTAAPSSLMETLPSNFALIRPSRPTRNVQGSEGRCHSRTQRFSPLRGSLRS